MNTIEKTIEIFGFTDAQWIALSKETREKLRNSVVLPRLSGWYNKDTMQEPQFTKGNWAAVLEAPYLHRFLLRNEHGPFGMFQSRSELTMLVNENAANARLIGAASDLFYAARAGLGLVKEIEFAYNDVPAGVDAWLAMARNKSIDALTKALKDPEAPETVASG